MTLFTCEHCQKQTSWLTRAEAVECRGVALGTIESWLDRGLDQKRMTDTAKLLFTKAFFN